METFKKRCRLTADVFPVNWGKIGVMINSKLHKTTILMKALLRSRLWGKPFFLSHMVTSRCNCSCPMCLWRDNSGMIEEMTTKEIDSFYRDSRQNGFVGTALWGGEPLLRSDLDNILASARKWGLTTLVISNGFYLEERLDELTPNLDAVIISLDYADGAQHDRHRGCPGLFQRAVNAVERLRRHHPRIKVLINCLIMRDNGESLHPLAELARHLDVSFFVCPVKEKTGSGRRDASAKGWQAGDEKEREVAKKLTGLKKAGHSLNNSYTYLNSYLGEQRSFHCRLPRIALIVRPDGEITHCMERETHLGNVRSETIHDILNSQPYRELLQKAPACNRCNNPNIVESSYMWQFQLEPLLNAAKVILRR